MKWIVLLTLTACGSATHTVGGSCTAASACEGGVCLSSGDFPGGYCSKSCSLTDSKSCPAGAVCIDDASGAPAGVQSVCYETCQSDSDCSRADFQCAEKANHKVCQKR